MRPKLLEIEGLQSFRASQKIDFGLLSETGLFGIFGPTGSGKSTVLDAITLALYGKVKRADSGTQGIINIHEKLAKVSFSFELLKDGHYKEYRVERVYQRKKGSPNSCEAKIARLIEITSVGEIPICDKAGEVSSTIKELLGLSHEDFTRAVVLPQNSFQEFLFLNNSERRGMLERIFYLEEYGKTLWEKLGKKMSQVRSRVDSLSGELKGYEDASRQALEEAHQGLIDTLDERDKVIQELKSLETRYHEAKEVWDLILEHQAILEKEQRHLEHEKRIAELREQLDKAYKADSLLERVHSIHELTKRLGSIKKELDDASDRLPVSLSKLNEARGRFEAFSKEFVVEQPKLIGLKTRLEDALGIQAEVVSLTERINGLLKNTEQLSSAMSNKTSLLQRESNEHQRLVQELHKLKAEAELIRVEPEYRQAIQRGLKLSHDYHAVEKNAIDSEQKNQKLRDDVFKLEQQLAYLRADIEIIQAEHDSLNKQRQRHIESCPEDKKVIMQKTERLHALQAVYDILVFRHKELSAMRSKLEKQQADLHLLKAKEASLEERRGQGQKDCDSNKEKLDIIRSELDRDIALRLSERLEEGKPCPVCGSEIHPNPVTHCLDDHFLGEDQLKKAEDDLKTSEAALKETEKLLYGISEQVKSLTEQNRLLKEELTQKEEAYQAEKLKLPEALREMELEPIAVELKRMNTVSQDKLKAIESWEKEQETLQLKLQKCLDSLNQQRLTENAILSELKVNQQNLSQSESSYNALKESYDALKLEYETFLTEHGIESIEDEAKAIASKDSRLNELQLLINQAETAVSARLNLAESLRSEIEKLKTDLVRLETELAQLQTQQKGREQKLIELAGQTNLSDEIRRVEEKLIGYETRQKDFQTSLKLQEEEYHALKNHQLLLENQAQIHSERLAKEEEQIESALLDKGFKEMAEVEAFILPKEEQQKLKQEIDKSDQEGFNLRAQKTMIETKLKSRTMTEDEWHSMRLAYQETAAYKEACVSKAEVAKNHFENVKSKHDKWVELYNSYELTTRKQGLLEQIQKILRAELRKDNSFIDYIAEERLRYVAAKASETLGVMTKYKYALELDTEAGFIIRDNANGGVCRSVTSLSGGETFLTSLSLALALSEQIQLKGQSPLEFFFLDEGFGTLDNSLLDTVIDALERLSKRERVIGLISHVPELRTRIGRRLVITPPSTQGEGSRVKIEKA